MPGCFLMHICCGLLVGGPASSKRTALLHASLETSLLHLSARFLSTVTGDMKMLSRVYGFEVLVGFGPGLTISTVSILTSIEVKPADPDLSIQLLGERRLRLIRSSRCPGNHRPDASVRRHHRGCSSDCAAPASVAPRSPRYSHQVTDRRVENLPSIITQLNQTQGHAVILAHSKSFSETISMSAESAPVAKH